MKIGLATEDWVGIAELRTDVERTLGQRCPDHYELEDLVQETLIKAARSRSRLGDPERLRSWVLRIAWNVYRDHVRKQARHRTYVVATDDMDVLNSAQPANGRGAKLFAFASSGLAYELEDVLAVLRGLITELGGDDRLLYKAYYEEGIGCSDLAMRLGLSTQSVKMRLFRMRKRLGRQMLSRAPLLLGSGSRSREAVA